MREPVVIKCGDMLIPLHQVIRIDIRDIERHEVTVYAHGYAPNEIFEYNATGFDAIEIVMLLKPSALEGRRLRWVRNAWAFHNFFGHPIVQILAWLGFKKQAIAFHDRTTPRPRT